MKMKEVLEQTDLTDRAVRLYMENGLVSPSCSENYAGRKNIEFSENDVEALKNVATLRKAGFSISEIKLLKQGSVPCRKTVAEFIEKTTTKIESDKSVVERLEAVVMAEDLSIETICESLNSATEEKEIPESDIKLSLAEKIEKCTFTILGVIGLVYMFTNILYIVLLCKLNFDYLYPSVKNLDWYFFAKLFIVIFVVASCIYLLLYYRRRKIFTPNKKRLIRHILISVISILLSIPFFFNSVYSIFSPNACSKTTSPNDYLIVDEFAKDDRITNFFPSEIHDYASYSHNIPNLLLFLPDTYPNSTKYYYKYYQDFFGGNEFVKIHTEWKLIDKYKEYSDFPEYYNKYKDKYLNMEFDQPVTIVTKGDWQYVYYDDSSENNWDKRYLYRIFAYNDKTETVRFIYTARYIKDPVDSAESIIPDYINMHW